MKYLILIILICGCDFRPSYKCVDGNMYYDRGGVWEKLALRSCLDESNGENYGK